LLALGEPKLRDSARVPRGVGTRVPSAVVQGFDSVLEAARGGADWAWDSIYTGLSPKVLGYLRGLGATEPDDLTGEVFVQVVRDLHRFHGDERAFTAWVLTVAHHRFLDHCRRGSRRPVDPVAEVPEPGTALGDAEEDALRELAGQRVQELLGGLPRDQRAVLLLRVVGGLTVEQVATAIGKRPGAVKALQRRGLAAVERRLASEAVPL
jgi:RNA polymerase sigma factor (sigma-70 family)